MPAFWLITIIAVAAVGIFALGLSLTLIFRGHNIKSEIGENEHMRRRGIKCAIETMREEAGGEIWPKECPECPPAGCTGCAGESGAENH